MKLAALWAAMLLAAGSAGELPPSARAGNTLVYGAGLKPLINDPNLAGNGWNEATSLTWSRLYRVGLRGKIEPDLVKRHEISADGLKWTLHLRHGVVWHDGRAFSSADVRTTLEQVFDPNVACDLDLNLPMVAGFDYPDERTVVVRLNQPAPLLPVPLSEIAVGPGPYRFAGKLESGVLEFVRHEPFHLGRPAVDRILIREIPDDAERAAALSRGEIDIAHIKPQQLAMIDGARAHVVRMTTGAWRGMPLNLRRPAMADPRVRQAIDLALDREMIVKEALPGGGAPAYQPLPPASWAFMGDLDRPYGDMERAGMLLDWAGWTRGPDGLRRRKGSETPLTLRLIVWKDETFRRTAAEVIRRQLAGTGIVVEQHLVDNVEYNRLAANMTTEYDGFIGGWGALLDPGDNLYKKFHSRGSQNQMGFSEPEVDRMLEEARAETDMNVARVIYRRLMERLRAEAVFLPLAYPEYLFGVSDRVTGIEPAVVDSWYEFPRNAWLWRLRP